MQGTHFFSTRDYNQGVTLFSSITEFQKEPESQAKNLRRSKLILKTNPIVRIIISVNPNDHKKQRLKVSPLVETTVIAPEKDSGGD